MCGLNGIFAYNTSASAIREAELVKTRDHMEARGPDGAGIWLSDDQRIGFGHRRLSILDLSDRANQPMISADRRFVVTFNGEIYNYPALKAELIAAGAVFRTTSDTEVLLHLFARDGEAMVSKLRGMFAFAIWDRDAKQLFLARDLYGIKPLYVSDDGFAVRFASQVKALLAGGAISRDPDPAGIVGFHIWGSVPEPFTLYRSIRALPAGHTQIVDQAGPREPRPFASIAQILTDGAKRPAPQEEVAARVKAAVNESVGAHLLADVDVGIFLSAGIDSGAILGMMRDAGMDRIRAITLSFEEFRGSPEDEAPLAQKVAALYGADHVVRTVTQTEFQNDMPAILHAMDQPSIDGVNTWFVSKAAREAGLKVALSGLGGDELLAGYPSFREIPKLVSTMRVPSAVPGFGRAARALLPLIGVGKRSPKLLGLLEYGGSYTGAYLLRRGLFLPFELKTVLDPGLVADGLKRLQLMARLKASLRPKPQNPISRIVALESSAYMRNQLLRDADWAGMAHSIEIRTPLVDSDLLRALSLVAPWLANGAGKQALAKSSAIPLPAAVSERAKTGFGVPTGRWANASSSRTAANKGAASRAWAIEVLERANSFEV